MITYVHMYAYIHMSMCIYVYISFSAFYLVLFSSVYYAALALDMWFSLWLVYH